MWKNRINAKKAERAVAGYATPNYLASKDTRYQVSINTADKKEQDCWLSIKATTTRYY